jgi:uncharacterized protein
MSLFGQFDVRVDPWPVEYGTEVPIDANEEPADETVDLGAEVAEDNWGPIQPQSASMPSRLFFVDGVRRIEARLIVTRGNKLCHGAFGAFGVGSVELSKGLATWGEERVGRLVALGSGQCLPTAVDVTRALEYVPISSASSEADGPLLAIHDQMRVAEERLARELAATDDNVVLSDGPLTFAESSRGCAIGYVKRFFRMYLPSSHVEILPRLPVGGRTPIFALRGTRRFARYSWFLRLGVPSLADSPFTGIVRLEVSEAVGVEAAKRFAALTAAALPRLAPSRGRDPRAPQNLLPIGALEWRLRRRLGDARLVRRQIESLVAKGSVHD